MSALLTSAEAGVKLRCTARQVTILCATGALRGVKHGRQWLIDPEDIDIYLEERANRPRRRQRRRRAA